MANWFPMALKDAARTWLMNLPEASISSWRELCKQFVANFKGTYERPLMFNDLHAVRQLPGEMLRKYIQRFKQVWNRVPHVSDAAIISAFSTGVTDNKMLEKLAINNDLESMVKLFEMDDRCAKAEEGRLFAHNVPNVEPATAPAKSKSKDPKCKTHAILAAEPEQKHAHGDDVAKPSERPFLHIPQHALSQHQGLPRAQEAPRRPPEEAEQ
jgi:hypothetical protein